MRNHPTTLRAKEHVENLRAKPLHVRENIALGASLAITLVVFVGWLGAFVTSNTFALAPAADTHTPTIENPIDKAKTSFGSFLGAAGASTGNATSPTPAITIIDSSSSDASAPQNATDAKVIHF